MAAASAGNLGLTAIGDTAALGKILESGTATTASNNLLGVSDFSTSLGEQNTTLSSTLFQDLLTNPMKALGFEISSGQNQLNQQAKTNAEFGTRSGGTTGSTQAAGAANRTNVINLMGKEQSGAASSLATSGANLLNTATSANEGAGQLGIDNAKLFEKGMLGPFA